MWYLQKYKALLNLPQKDDEKTTSYLGKVQNVENSTVEMKDRHEEEENSENHYTASCCPHEEATLKIPPQKSNLKTTAWVLGHTKP